MASKQITSYQYNNPGLSIVPGVIYEVVDMAGKPDFLYLGQGNWVRSREGGIPDTNYIPNLQTNVTTLLDSGIPLSGQVNKPLDFTWEYSFFPTMFDTGNQISHNVNSISKAHPDCYLPTAPIYYVDPVNGSDSNTGLGSYISDFTNALKSAKVAQDKLNLTGVAGQIWVKTYSDPSIACTRTPSAVISTPTVPTLFRAYGGGKVRIRTAEATYSTTQVSSSTTYKLAGTTVTRVFDLTRTTPDGSFIELKKITGHTADTALSSVDTWATVGSDQYIRRSDGQAVTGVNTLILRSSVLVTLNQNTPSGCMYKDCIFEGIIDINHNSASAPDRTLVFEDCEFAYSHATMLRVDSWPGLIVFNRCKAKDSMTDLYNFHNYLATKRIHVILADCTGNRAASVTNGSVSNPSSNSLTGHETNISVLDINGVHTNCFGANVIFVGSSQSYLVNPKIEDSFGDIVMGGNYVPTGVRAEDTASIWIYKGIISSNNISMSTSGTGKIRTFGTNVKSGSIRGDVLSTSW